MSPGHRITDREVEVLRAYLDTGSVTDAARRMGLAPSTVKQHLLMVRIKLGVTTTAQAVERLHERLRKAA